MKTTEEHQALIIGAGIGGLAAAIALRRAGYAVQVFERVQGLKEVGAGLTLWPNAIKALRKLGQQAIIDEQSIPVAVGGIYTWKGKVLAQATTRGGTPGWRPDHRTPSSRTAGSFTAHVGGPDAKRAGGAVWHPPGAF